MLPRETQAACVPCDAETHATCKETLQGAAMPLEQIATISRARGTFEKYVGGARIQG